MRILVVTNDGTVFNDNRGPADRMFAGRLTEVIRFTEELRKQHEVTLCIISWRYGPITGDTEIERYEGAPDSDDGYREMQRRTDFAGRISEMSGSFDSVMVFVPKGIMRILLENDGIHCNVTACTSLDLRGEVEARGWQFYERRGARIGKKNAMDIISSFSSSSLL